jgi:ABC-2 type transport system ATP-binding protein
LIKIENIVKKIAKKSVINKLSLDIPKGIIFGLLGPNGAGKTTLIRMLCGILKSDSGTIEINDKPVEEAKHIFGYVSQSFGQYEELSVWENIVFYAQMYGVTDTTRLNTLLNRYNLEQYRDTPAGELSGGYKRRLALVCALAHNPLVLFLDEPTAGIDPVTRKLLWDDFYALSMEGKTLFVTTHYMEEAERCHQLAFLAKGEIVAEGTPATIKDSLNGVRLFSITLSYTPLAMQYLSDIEGIVLINQFGNELRIMIKPDCDIETIQKILEDKLQVKSKLKQSTLDLEDVFIALTQDKAL